MINTNELNEDSCAHGIPRSKPCFFCAEAGINFQRDAEIYEEMYIKTSNTAFELAFKLAERIEIWKQATKSSSLVEYFKGIRKCRRIRWSDNSLRQAYTVATEFPDLLDKKENLLCFSIYREIVNTGEITLEQKQEIRKIAEEKKLSFKKVRELIKTEFRKDEADKNDESKIKEEIIFHTEEDFLRQVKEFLQRQKGLKLGSTITLRLRKQKEERNERIS